MKPIKMTEQLALEMAKEMLVKLGSSGRIDASSFTYTKTYETKQKDAVEVNFTEEAYQEMFALIDHFSCEVAWRGVVNRIDETHFQITKILIYPQTVSDVTVDTDQEEFNKWYEHLEPDVVRNLRFQGHSHVNMGVSPSGRDMSDQWRLVSGLRPTNYQIFMICNKRRDINVWVYDLAKNVVYEGSDVKITIGDFNSSRFLEDADKFVKKQVYRNFQNTPPLRPGEFVGKTTPTPANYAPYSKGEETKKTVTGAAAPKGRGSEDDLYPLKKFYDDNPELLENIGNSSCAPFRRKDY